MKATRCGAFFYDYDETVFTRRHVFFLRNYLTSVSYEAPSLQVPPIPTQAALP